MKRLLNRFFRMLPRTPHRTPHRSARSQARRLAFEYLEDRTLLAVTANTLLFPNLTEIGPRFSDAGQVEGIQNSTVAGAVSTIAFDPSDATHQRVYIGTVNGGVWKTDNINATTTFDANRVNDSALPPTAPTPLVATIGGAGNVNVGKHLYKVSFFNGATGIESVPSRGVAVTLGVASQVALTNIPLGPGGTTERRIYRTLAGTNQYKLLTVLADNNTATFTDNTADNPLGASRADTVASPQWRPLTDDLGSLSISALAFDSTNARNLYAGTGNFSSSREGGNPVGVYKSTDAGQTWVTLNPGNVFDGQKVTSLIVNGPTILVGTTRVSDPNLAGLFRSTNGGATFSLISGTVLGGQLPAGPVTDLKQTTANGFTNLFAAVVEPVGTAGDGVYRSPDGGATWAPVTVNNVPGQANSATPIYDFDNGTASVTRVAHGSVKQLKLAVSGAQVYAGVVEQTGSGAQLTRIFRSDNLGATWQFGPPTPGSTDQKNGNNQFFSLNPNGQGDLHFSITADPTAANVVYAGGESQPVTSDGTNVSSVGATEFGGRLFRIDTAAANNTGTQIVADNAGGTAPHADSRALIVDSVSNSLYEADDGGIYRLSTPTTAATRRWVSLNGNLDVAEVGALAYDPINDVALVGTQDIGTLQQGNLTQNPAWDELLKGDGNTQAVGVENNNSIWRYSMSNNFNGLRRSEFDRNNANITPAQPLFAQPGNTFQFLKLAASGSPDAYESGLTAADSGFNSFAHIPYAVNAASPDRLALGFNDFYVSNDRGDTLTRITGVAGARFQAIAFGNPTNADIIYAGFANLVAVREGNGNVFTRAIAPSGAAASGDPAGLIRAVAIDPNDARVAYAVDNTNVYVTFDSGATWANITGSLLPQNLNQGLRSVLLVRLPAGNGSPDQDVLLVGGTNGLFRAVNPLGAPAAANYKTAAAANLSWTRFGGLPNAPITGVVYSTTANVLEVSTRGRGVWKLAAAAAALRQDPVLVIQGDATASVLTLKPNPGNNQFLDLFVGNTNKQGTYDLTRLRQIRIVGKAGNITLTVDSRLRLTDGIVFQGGTGTNQLIVKTNTGDAIAANARDNAGTGQFTVTNPNGNALSIAFTNLSAPVQTPNFSPPQNGPNLGNAVQGGVRSARTFFQNLESRARNVPVLNNAVQNLGNPNAVQNQAVADQGGAVEGGDSVPTEGAGILGRLFDLANGAVHLSDLGDTVNDPQAIRQFLDDLDNVPGNITLTQTPADVRYDVRIDKVLDTNSSFDLSLLGGGFALNGNVDLSAHIQVHLIFGVDQGGFYLDTADNPDPELTVSDLHIAGSVQVSGLFGLLSVGLDNATLTTDPNVRLTVTLHEPPDPFGLPPDGKIRPYEFFTAPMAHSVDFGLTGNPNHDLNHPDLAFQTDLFVSLGASKLTFPGVGISFVDITNPTQVRLTGVQPLLDLLAKAQAAVVSGLGQVGAFAANLDNTAPLNQPLDLLGKNPDGSPRSLGSTLQVGNLFNDRLVQPVKDYFAGLTVDPATGIVDLPTLDDLAQAVLDANGLSGNLSTTFGPGFSIGLEGAAIVAHFPLHAARALPIDLDLGLNIPGLSVDTAANVTLRAAFDTNLSVGVDLRKIVAGQPLDAIFVGIDQAPTISAQILDTGGVSFNLTLGGLLGLGAQVHGTLDTPQGKALLTAGVGLHFNDPNHDGRLTFSDLSGGIARLFSIVPAAQVGLTIPLTISLGGVPFDLGTPAPAFTINTLTDGGLFGPPSTATPPPGGILTAGGRLLIVTPDFKRLINLSLLFGLIRNPDIFLAGLDKTLGALQGGLDSEVTAHNLPLVGSQLQAGAQFIQDFRSGLLAEIRAKTQNAGNRLIQFVQDGLFEALGPANANILVDANGQPPGPNARPEDFVRVTFPGDGTSVQFDLNLHKDKQLDLPFDLGLPGLPFTLDASGKVHVGLGFDLHLGFGISIDPAVGFYFVTNTQNAQGQNVPEARLAVDVTTPGLNVSGQLGFLGVQATDLGTTHFHGAFGINLQDAADNDGRLTVQEMAAGSASDFIKPVLTADAGIHLHLITGFGNVSFPATLTSLGLSAALFPSLSTDLNVTWSFDSTTGLAGARPKVAFDNVRLDLGSFLTQFAAPLIQNLQKITQPLAPVISALETPIPGLDSLSGLGKISILNRPPGSKITFLDLLVGLSNSPNYQDPTPFINVLDGLNHLTVPTSNVQIDLGHFEVTDPRPGQTIAKVIGQTAVAPPTGDASKPGSVLNSADAATANPAAGKPGFFTTLKNALKDVSFPILENPTDIFTILSGQLPKDGTLFTFTPPKLTNAGFALHEDFPLPFFGDFISVGFGGSFTLTTNMTFGYDLQGVRDFVARGKQNPLDLLDGFFVSSRDSRGFDLPAFTLKGSLSGTAEAGPNLEGIAEVVAGFEGGVRADVSFAINDPSRAGKERFTELVANVQQGFNLFPSDPVKALTFAFDMNGDIEGFFNIFAAARSAGKDLVRFTLTLGSGTIFRFTTHRDLPPGLVITPPTADFGVIDTHLALVQGATAPEATDTLQVGFRNLHSNNLNFDPQFQYDLANTGTFANVSGGVPEPATVTVPPQFVDDGPHTVTLHGRLTDANSGLFSDYTTTVTLRNRPPLSHLTNNGPFVGPPVTVAFSNDNQVPAALPGLHATGTMIDPTLVTVTGVQIAQNPLDKFYTAINPATGGPIMVNAGAVTVHDRSAMPLPGGDALLAPPGSTFTAVFPDRTPNATRVPVGTATSLVTNFDLPATIVFNPRNPTVSMTAHIAVYYWALAGEESHLSQIITTHPEIELNNTRIGLLSPGVSMGRTTFPAGTSGFSGTVTVFMCTFTGDVALPGSLLTQTGNQLRVVLPHVNYNQPDAEIDVAVGLTGTFVNSAGIDPSSADTSAGFTFSYDFNNDGNFTSTYYPDGQDIVNSPIPLATVPTSIVSAPGSHVVHARITDKDGGFTDLYTTIGAPNFALAPAGGPYVIHEGDALQLAFGAEAFAVASFDWQINHSSVHVSGPNPTVTWDQLRQAGITQSLPTAFPIDLTFRHTDDFGGDTVTAATTLTVLDTPPTLQVEGSPTATEGQPYTLQLDAPVSPADDAVTRWRIAWGDGQTDTVFFDGGVAKRTFAPIGADGHVLIDATGKEVVLTEDLPSSAYPLQVPHTYAFTENGYAITARATDADGRYDARPLSVAVLRVPPSALVFALSARAINEGDTVNVSGSFAALATHLVHTVRVNWGDGTDPTELTLNEGERTFGDVPARVLQHRYLDNPPGGSATVTITVTDAFGGTVSASAPLTIANVAPVPVIAAPARGAVEGSLVNLVGQVSDPGPADTAAGFTFAWTLLRNQSVLATGSAPTFAFTPTDNGDYTVTLAVTDQDGTTSTTTLDLPVANVAPSPVILLPAGPATEDTPITLLSTATDPSPVDTTAGFTFAWSVTQDGQPVVLPPGTVASAAAFTFTPEDDGVYAVTLQVTDKDGGTGTATQTMVVAHGPPAVTLQGVPDITPEGTPLLLSALVTDASPVDTAAGFGYAWQLLQGNRVVTTGADTTFAVTPDDNGPYTVVLDITDTDGATTEVRQAFAVTNVAPAPAIVGAPDVSPEGTPINLTASAADPSHADTTAGFAFAWTVTKDGAAYAAGSGPAFAFTPDDNAVYLVALTATDKDGGTSTTTSAIVVSNVAPDVVLTGDPGPLHGVVPVLLHATASDPSPTDTAAGFSFAWNVTKDDQPYASGTGPDVAFTPAGKGNYQVSLAASDKDGGTSIANDTVVVLNTPPSNLALSFSSVALNEGDTTVLAGTFQDPDGADGHVVDVDWGDGSAHDVFPLGAGVLSFAGRSHRYLDNPAAPATSFHVVVTVTDPDLDRASAATDVLVRNVSPTPAIGGAPGTSPEGTALRLTASATDPSPVDVAAGFAFAWNVTKNGAAYAAGTGPAFTFTPDDNAVFVVTLTATDKDGGTGTTRQTVTAFNVPPVASLSGPASAARGQARTFTLSASDPSPIDVRAGFTYQVAWGDGVRQTVAGPAGLTLNHVFTTAGTYQVQLTATDKDGGTSSAATRLITVGPVDLQGDVLVVGGTVGNDEIRVERAECREDHGESEHGESTALAVEINEVLYGPFTGVGRIVVYGQAGNDSIAIDRSITLPALLFAGNGNTVLRAGGGATVLVGGSGNDTLIGGPGRNILIGGGGRDQLDGGAGESVLIGGNTDFNTNEVALWSLLQEWARPDEDFATRVAHLTSAGSGGLNGAFALNASTVHNDGAADALDGDAQRDLFFISLGDTLDGNNKRDTIIRV